MQTLELIQEPSPNQSPDQRHAQPSPHAAPRPIRHWSHNGACIHVKATAEETNRAHSLIELTVPGNTPGAPLHYHQTFIESFYVLEGEIQVIRGDEILNATTGTLLHMPIGTVHGYHNSSDKPARFLVICTPGGFDAYFTDLIAHMQRDPNWPSTNHQELINFGRQHDTHYV